MSSNPSLCCSATRRAGGPEAWRLGNSAGRRLLGGGRRCFSNGLYWLYEMSHAALKPARAFADVTQLYFKNPLNPLAHTTYGKTVAAAAELFERSTRRYGKPDWGIDSALVGGERAPIHITTVVGAAVLPAAAFRAHVLPHAAPAAAEAADRRADVGPLRHAAARHGRGVPAQPRRLHHRLGRRAHGAAVGGPLRSRRLHRLRHQHPALASAATPMSSRCASRRCRCWPRPR